MLPLVAIVVLGATPNARGGVVVQSASVTITKVTDPASDPQDFHFDNGFYSSPVTSNTLDTDPTSLGTPSSYQFFVTGEDLSYLYVGEVEPSDWQLTDIQCTGDDDVSYNVDGNNVALYADAGEDIRCTFYNTKRAQLTIQKVTLPGTDERDFRFDLTGAALPDDYYLDTDPGSMFTGSNITYSVWGDDLGAYTITEAETTGWLLIDLVCTGAGNDSSVNLATRTATLDIDGGELVTCTFTNGKLPLVTLTKVTVPASDPQDFYIDILGTFNTSLDTDPASVDTPNSEMASLYGTELGPKTIEETAVEGWALTDITCTEGSATSTDLPGGSVTIELEADSNIECIFTNTKDADPTDAPPTDEPPTDSPPTDPPGTPDPTDEQGGVSDAPTEPGTSTEGTSAEGSPVGVGLALIALILLSGVLLITRPKRAGK